MSRMSAPCAAIAAAWATALAGSMKRPPSEKESGVTLRMPMTSGRPSASNAESASRTGFCAGSAAASKVRASPMAVALRWKARGCQEASLRGRAGLFIADLELQLLGVFDPVADHFLGRQQADHFALLVGLGHRVGEIGRVAILELLDGINAGGLQQLGIFLADALDAHAVGDVGPAQQPLFVETGLHGEHFASAHGARRLEQAFGRPNPHRFEDRGCFAVDPVDIGDGIGHPDFPARFLLYVYAVEWNVQTN